VLELSSALEYELAPVALDVVVAAHGSRAVDALFRAPPRSEEVIIDPAALEARDRPVPVELPAFAPDETPRGRADDWGAYSWYLVLASRLPWSEALAAVDGWGGDRARSYTRTVDGGEQACIRLAVTGDTERDTTELATAIAAWSAAMPPGAVHDTREGELVVVSACATGDAPTPVDDALLAAYDRLWERTDEMWYLVDRHTPPSVRTRCVAAGLVADDMTRPLLARRHELTRAERRTVSDRLDAETRRCA
jgi:hypothetical protein